MQHKVAMKSLGRFRKTTWREWKQVQRSQKKHHLNLVYSKEPKRATAFDLFAFFRTDLIQSEAKRSSTSDWLMSAWQIVS